MTLPWFLNPWAEVRRLRAELKWRDYMRLDMAQAYRDERAQKYRFARDNTGLQCENSVLRLRIAELEKQQKKPDWITPARTDTAQARVHKIFSEMLCGCVRCAEFRPGFPGPSQPGWRYACEKCGNKRCPHHDWHGFKCTSSNEPDQIGEEE